MAAVPRGHARLWLGVETLGRDGADLDRLAGLADAALAAVEQSRRRAMDLNDNVMQSLVLARYRLGTAPDEARRSLNQAIAQCQRIVDELLGGDDVPVVPGSLRRDAAAPG